MTNTISNTDDIIDVRDIIARVEELEAELENIDDMPEGDMLKNTVQGDVMRAELAQLQGLLEDLKGNGGDEQWRGDWYPVTLIRDSHFEDAMDELLEDCGDLPKNLPCYLSITVDYTALQQDYASCEYEGVTYWYR